MSVRECVIVKTVFYQLSRHLEFRQKYSAACRIFNSLLHVWISPNDTQFLVFDLLHDDTSTTVLTRVVTSICA